MRKNVFFFAVAIALLGAISCQQPTDSVAVQRAPIAVDDGLDDRATAAANYVKIASFNVGILGATKESRPKVLTLLAKTAANFDVLALQEVGSNNSTATEENAKKAMDVLVAKINSVSGTTVFKYVRGNQFAFVYRTDRVVLEKYGAYVGAKPFTYKPLTAKFRTKSGNFDFALITVHVRPTLAKVEIPYVATAMKELRTRWSEPDVICLGDYNADGSYYDEGDGTTLIGFSSSTYISAIQNSKDTTVAASSNTYDRIQMFKQGLETDFTGSSGVFKFSDYYDVSGAEGTATTAGTELALSDHYPVWAKFYVNRDAS